MNSCHRLLCRGKIGVDSASALDKFKEHALAQHEGFLVAAQLVARILCRYGVQ
jgi:hypothetical protein